MSITISVDDTQIQATLRRIRERVGNLRPALAAVANELQSITDHAFQTETDPTTGQRWQRTRRNVLLGFSNVSNQVLHDTGQLAASIQPRSGDNFAEVGTNKAYAPVHQFGSSPYVIRPRHKKALAFGGVVVKSVNHPGVPARPFLGLSAADKAEIITILEQHIID